MARTLTPLPVLTLPVAAALLLWQGLLGADYVISRFGLGDTDWPRLMAILPMEALWIRLAWAAGVWLGVAAALALLARDNVAVVLFFLAAAGFALAGAGIGLAAPADLILPMPLAAILPTLVALPLAGWLHARGLNKRGALR